MRKKSDFVLRLALIVGDGLALVLSFAMAYFIRVHVDPRPYVFESQLYEFTMTIVWLVPILLVILASMGLYKKSVFLGKSRLPEIWRVFLAAILSVSALIVYDYFMDKNIFPVRVVALLSAVLSFVFLMVERILVRLFARQKKKKNYGTKHVVIVGNHKNTGYLADYITGNSGCEYCLVGIVADKKYIPGDLIDLKFGTLEEALKHRRADVIFQTDENETEKVFRFKEDP